jgi:magnesium chelatase subunit H
MRANGHKAGYRVVIITLDAHAAGPAARASDRLARDFPGLSIAIHAAAEWAEDPSGLERARQDIANATSSLPTCCSWKST